MAIQGKHTAMLVLFFCYILQFVHKMDSNDMQAHSGLGITLTEFLFCICVHCIHE